MMSLEFGQNNVAEVYRYAVGFPELRHGNAMANVEFLSQHGWMKPLSHRISICLSLV